VRRRPARRAWAAACCLAAAPAHGAVDWGGAAVLTSDYVFRGASHSGGAAAAQLDLHVRGDGGAFAGIWTSSSESARSPRRELNLYAGSRWALSERWTATGSVVRYRVAGSPDYAQHDYDEVAAALRYADRVVVQAALAPDASYDAGTASRVAPARRALEAALRQPAWRSVAIVASAGRYQTELPRRPTYSAWSAGLAATAGPVELTLSRFAVDRTARRLFGEDAAAGRWVLTAAWRF
jgi:uncharacterized protein (TIGR02001 family)